MSCCPPDGSHGKMTNAAAFSSGRTIVIEDSDGERVRNLPCYVASNSAPLATAKRIVIIYTDVFGVDSGRHKIFADQLSTTLNNGGDDGDGANATTAVLIPDFFRGKPLAAFWINWLPDVVNFVLALPQILWSLKFRVTEDAIEEDLMERLLPWIVEQQRRSRNNNKTETEDVLSSRDDDNVIKFSVVGFCFGGWLVAKTLAFFDMAPIAAASDADANNKTIKADVVCGIGIHPSLQVESKIYGRQEESLAEATKTKPILLLPAGNDDGTKPQSDVVKVLADARNLSRDDIAIEFGNMKHGWVVRGDGENDSQIRDAQERAFQLTVDFINKHHPANL